MKEGSTLVVAEIAAVAEGRLVVSAVMVRGMVPIDIINLLTNGLFEPINGSLGINNGARGAVDHIKLYK